MAFIDKPLNGHTVGKQRRGGGGKGGGQVCTVFLFVIFNVAV